MERDGALAAWGGPSHDMVSDLGVWQSPDVPLTKYEITIRTCQILLGIQEFNGAKERKWAGYLRVKPGHENTGKGILLGLDI